MGRLKALSVLVIMTGVAVLAGCNDKGKELAALTEQYNALQAERGDLKSSLDASRDKNDELMTLLASKDAELDAARIEIANLKAQPKPVPEEKRSDVPTGWTQIPGGAKIALASDILFASGRASLSKQGTARLRQVASTIRATYPNSTIRVYGFTDGDPIKKTKKLWTDNLDLSSNRAMAVVRELKSIGIKAEKLEAIGMGETHPVASNSTTAGKARNRRVEIVAVE